MGVSERTKVIIGTVSLLAFAFAMGIVTGWFGKPPDGVDCPSGQTMAPSSSPATSADERNKRFLTDTISKEMIGQNLRNMTRQPHLAGTEQNKKLAENLVESWKSFNFDAQLIDYDVLLSYPGDGSKDPSLWNQVYLYRDDTLINSTATKEMTLDPDQDNPAVVPPFNAYSKAAHFNTTKLIYANYGRKEDFDYLKKMSVNFDGAIVIMRYGKIFRGNKVNYAQEAGAAGVILYSDPADYAINGKSTFEETFPNSWWLPPTGVQRGTTYVESGDPNTQLYPARDYSYKESTAQLRADEIIPDIPSHPISYRDALPLLSQLTGPVAPLEWQGDLLSEYKIGGNLSSGWSVGMNINNYEETTKVYNAIGIIPGVEEPDRYVMLGNHRDAWVFGAVDPTSGTAALLEVSRAFSELYKTGWRPRRSIVFCSWGAEEYGLIGSTEWVEEYMQNLKQRTVLYLNVDIAVVYNYVMEVHGSSLAQEHFTEITKLVPDPDGQFTNLYENWKNRSSNRYGALGSGSDHGPFFATAGITSIDLSYTFNHQEWDISGYPLYHSVYETYDLVARLTDEGFHCHQAVGRVMALMTQSLADSSVIPFNTNTMAETLVRMHSDFNASHYQDLVSNSVNSTKLMYFQAAVNSFHTTSNAFMARVSMVNTSRPYEVRMINDQLMYLERALLDPMGLPDRPQYKNMIFAPSSQNVYGAAGFPGVVDLIVEAQDEKDPTAKLAKWKKVDQELSKVIFIIESLGSTLSEVTRFYRITV